jgi:hypothetical protein
MQINFTDDQRGKNKKCAYIRHHIIDFKQNILKNRKKKKPDPYKSFHGYGKLNSNGFERIRIRNTGSEILERKQMSF